MRTIHFALVMAFLLPCSFVFAQLTSGGNFVMASSFGLSTASSDITIEDGLGDADGERPSSAQFSISPKLGYFVMDNLAVGIGLDYTFSEVKEPNKDRTKDSDLLFGPFGRMYLPLSDDVAVFLEGNFGFGNSSDIMDFNGETQNISTNIFAIGVGPGLTVFSNDAIGVSAIFKYNYARSDFDTEIAGIKRQTITKTNQFDFSVGVSFYFAALTRAGY